VYLLNKIYFTREKENSGPLLSVNEVDGRVAEALQVNLRTVSRICGERQKGLPLETPGQKRNKPKKKSEDLPDGIKTSVRNTIYDMKQNGKHSPACKANYNRVSPGALRVPFMTPLPRCHSALATVTNSLAWANLLGLPQKSQNNIIQKEQNFGKRKLKESACIQLNGGVFPNNVLPVKERVNVLKQYYNSLTSENPLQCVYLVETWIYSKGSFKELGKITGHEGTGKRFIVLHAGTKHGFVENASLVFSSTSKSADYHDEMNREMFDKWMTEKLCSCGKWYLSFLRQIAKFRNDFRKSIFNMIILACRIVKRFLKNIAQK
ncbi:hypothetical protein NQ315_014899, partial [Exocentrus adspersus]